MSVLVLASNHSAFVVAACSSSSSQCLRLTARLLDGAVIRFAAAADSVRDKRFWFNQPQNKILVLCTLSIQYILVLFLFSCCMQYTCCDHFIRHDTIHHENCTTHARHSVHTRAKPITPHGCVLHFWDVYMNVNYFNLEMSQLRERLWF